MGAVHAEPLELREQDVAEVVLPDRPGAVHFRVEPGQRDRHASSRARGESDLIDERAALASGISVT